MDAEKLKKRVNLYLDKEAVENARKLDINLSGVVSSVLEQYVPVPASSKNESYSRLFDKMRPVLEKYDIGIKIGSFCNEIPFTDSEGGPYNNAMEIGELFFNSDEFSLWSEMSSFKHKPEGTTEVRDVGGVGTDFKIPDLFYFLKKNDNSYLFSPGEILRNFIKRVAEKKKDDEEKSQEIEQVIRVIDAIAPNLLGETVPSKKVEKDENSKPI